MGWNYDIPPLEYLEQRVRYYKKKKGHVKNLINNETLWNRYGKSLPEVIERRIIQIETRIKQFNKAINKLKQKSK